MAEWFWRTGIRWPLGHRTGRNGSRKLSWHQWLSSLLGELLKHSATANAASDNNGNQNWRQQHQDDNEALWQQAHLEQDVDVVLCRTTAANKLSLKIQNREHAQTLDFYVLHSVSAIHHGPCVQ